MSKFRNRLMKRVMSVILSGAMVMSSMTLPNMTAYAAEDDHDTRGGYSELLSEDEEIKAEETDNKTAENPDQEERTGQGTSDEDRNKEPDTESGKGNEPDQIPEPDTGNETASETILEEDPETVPDDSAQETQTDDKETPENETISNKGADVYMEGTVDLTGGLEADTEYGDDVVKVGVLEFMKYTEKSTTIAGVSYGGYVAGENNPDPNKGNVPIQGAVFKIKALKPAEITFVIKDTGTKPCSFVRSDGTGIAPSSSDHEANAPLPDGAHKFKMDTIDTYYFYVSGSKVGVYNISWQAKKPRPEWASIDPPAISDMRLDNTDKSKINVTVDALIGEDGADKVTVYMYDEEGIEAGTAESTKAGTQTTLALSPTASGKYKFKAVTSRQGETDLKESAVTEEFIDFKLALAIPANVTATNRGKDDAGKGSVEIEWEPVAGADKYIVEVVGHDDLKQEAALTSKIIKGLTIGETYQFTVRAARGEDEMTEPSAPVSCAVTGTEKRDWKFTVYGNGTSKDKDTCTENADGSVRIRAASGKVVPNSNDGLAFYYTEINPNTTNFTFSANAHVNSWTYSNGQEGFGIMAADATADINSGSRVWNNSYQAVISKISYRWTGVAIAEDNSGASIEMQLGVGATEKIGVTPEDVAALKTGELQSPKKYKAEQTAIDTTFAKYGEGQYNMVANYTNEDAPIGSDHELYEDFYLKIQKNNTGYFVTYAKYVMEDGKCKLDKDGKKIVDDSTAITKKYYDPEALSVLDANTVYVGVFAARNADITFTDMDFTTIPCDEDAPRDQNRPVKYLNLSTSVLSGSVTNTPDYTFMFASNWNGTFRLMDSSGNVLSKHTENGKEIDYYNVIGTLDPDIQACQDGDDAKDTKVRVPLKDLAVGVNTFTIEYQPDADWTPEKDKYTEQAVIKLKSYAPVKTTFKVEYRKYGQEGQTIYAAPDGLSTNIGTKESPLDIYTAVKYVQPGQTILLAGGHYSLTQTLSITRGINGKPETDENGEETYNKYIKMMGDPDDVKNDNRPVLDFNGMVAAVVAVGDYWYFKDFDVIRCKDGEKGIQVSGSWCVFDRVNTYRNGSTGMQICRAANTDTYHDWPHDNLILNCNSYLNVDKGYEDADGFAAKLTSGSNNVFDGCIAAFNADDGWDLFAKAQTGSIGGVVIQNSIAYRNGYVLMKNGKIDEKGELTKGKGNGNGFKMGGDGLPAGSQYDDEYEERANDPNVSIPNIGHRLYNSLAFGNKSKGFDSNSAPNVKAYKSISFNNDASNISFTTYDTNPNTDYELQNVISIRTPIEPSKVEPDVKEFPAEGGVSYKTTHSLNFMDEVNPGSKSAAVYFSLKKAKDMKAKVKVWWRSSAPDTDCEMMILSEGGEILDREKDDKGFSAAKRISNTGGLIVTELETKGKEKCYLGAKGGSYNLYKVEITATTNTDFDASPYDKDKESIEGTYTVDISKETKYNKYTQVTALAIGGKEKIVSKPVEITLYYRTTPGDTVSKIGKQKPAAVENDTVYYWDVENNVAKNKSKAQITAADFESLDYPYLDTVSPEGWRDEHGRIKTGDFLKLKPNAGSYPADGIPSLGGTPSNEIVPGEETDGSTSIGNSGAAGGTTEGFGGDLPSEGINAKDESGEYKYFGKIWAADIKHVDYTDKEDIVYTGKAITPEVHVRFSGNDTMLKKGRDYKLTYKDNVNAGTATVIITGAGNYAGYDNTKTFEILPISITDKSVSIPSSVAVVSGGDASKEIKPTWQGKALKKDKDYTVETKDGNLVVKGKDNFVGEKPVTVHTADADKLISKAKVKITTPAKDLVYKGSDVEPECEVTLGGSTLTKVTDYTVEYANNFEIGKATLTVVGNGTTYFGSKSVTFSIKGGNLKDANVTYTDKSTGKAEDVDMNEYTQKIDGIKFNGSTCQIPVNLIMVKMNDKELKNNVDYRIVQKGMEKAGTGTITIKGINGYTGVQSFKYKIAPIDINDDNDIKDNKIKFEYAPTSTYTVGGVKYIAGDSFNIKVNGSNIDSKHYKLSYKNNAMIGKSTDEKPPTIVVTGRNGLKGKVELPFTIDPAVMTGNPDIVLSAKDIATNGKPIKYSDLKKATITVTQTVNLRNKKLAAGRDYDKDSIEYYFDKNDNHIIDEGVDTLLDIKSKEVIAEFDTTKGYMTVLVRVKAAANNPKCCFKEGYVDGYFRVGTYDINKAKIINKADRVFGKEYNSSTGVTSALAWDAVIANLDKYIEVNYKNASGTEEPVTWKQLNDYVTRPEILDDGNGFVIVPDSYKKNERVGTASFIIRGTGMYAGTKRVTFKILSKKAADKSAAKPK